MKRGDTWVQVESSGPALGGLLKKGDRQVAETGFDR